VDDENNKVEDVVLHLILQACASDPLQTFMPLVARAPGKYALLVCHDTGRQCGTQRHRYSWGCQDAQQGASAKGPLHISTEDDVGFINLACGQLQRALCEVDL
jgi:hypothetical protein